MRKQWTISVLCAALILPALLSACGADSADAGGTVLSTTSVKEESTTAVAEISKSDMTETASKTTTVTVKTTGNSETSKKTDKKYTEETTKKKSTMISITETEKKTTTTEKAVAKIKSYTLASANSIMQGTPLKFTEGAKVHIRGDINEQKNEIFIIDSYQKWQQALADLVYISNSDKTYTANYFKEKALLIPCIVTSGTDDELKMNYHTVVVSNDKLCFGVSKTGSSNGTISDTLNDFTKIIEVKKSDIKNIASFYIYSGE